MERTRIPGLGPKERHPDWQRLYETAEERSLPWYFPELDPDFGIELGAPRTFRRTVLDVGCGFGTQAAAMAEVGFKVTGIDLSRAAIAAARGRYRMARFIVDDITRSSLTRVFDVVTDRGCFHVLPRSSHGDYVRAVRDLLGENGLLLLKTFCNEQRDAGFGPFRFSVLDLHRIFGASFQLLKVRRTFYQGTGTAAPVAWFSVLRRRKQDA